MAPLVRISEEGSPVADMSHGRGVQLGQVARPVASLEYGRQAHRARLRWRHLVIALLLGLCVAGSWWAGRSARDRTQDYLYTRQAARHVEPARTVVYEGDAEKARELVKAGAHVPLGREALWPSARPDPESFDIFKQALDRDSLEAVGALVFLHELQTPSGLRRIVAVRFLPAWLDGRALSGSGLVAHVFEPGGLIDGPDHLSNSHARMLVPVEEPVFPEATPEPGMGVLAPLDDAGRLTLASPTARACLGTVSPVLRQTFDPYGQGPDLRWYAGQPDQQDTSHFTIDYELNGQRGTVDGYLSDDGQQVRMHLRPQGLSVPANQLATEVSTTWGRLH